MNPSLSAMPARHLHRLTDSQGLIHAARGDCPDRFGGYETIDNADALRWCAMRSATGGCADVADPARTYFSFLRKGRDRTGRVRHQRDARGTWSDRSDDALVQSCVARALAAVIRSELPIDLRLEASEWWPLLARHVSRVRTARAAGNWLTAMASLPAAHPGRDPARMEALARWLLEDCYYPIRSNEWEWFELLWKPSAACVPMGMWLAAEALDEPRYRVVAEASTQFVIEHLFEEGLFMPVGTRGGWSRNTDKAVFDQMPAEAGSVVELLCVAERVSGSSWYGRFAEYANAWFTGNNVRGEEMIDPSSSGCYDAIRVNGIDMNQGAPAALARLLSRCALDARPELVIEETTIYATGLQTAGLTE